MMSEVETFEISKQVSHLADEIVEVLESTKDLELAGLSVKQLRVLWEEHGQRCDELRHRTIMLHKELQEGLSVPSSVVVALQGGLLDLLDEAEEIRLNKLEALGLVHVQKTAKGA